MNYIVQLNQFWKLRRSKRITSIQADLYYFLLQECNGKDWENPFECSNKLICASIGISEPTLIDARNRLKQYGLIEFKPGKRSEMSPVYELVNLNNLSKNRVQALAEGLVETEQTPEPYTKQNKTRGKKLDAKASSDLKTPGSKKNFKQEENAGCAPQVEGTTNAVETEKEKSVYQLCISAYDGFIRDKTGMGAKIDGMQGKALKSIISYLATQIKNKAPGIQQELLEKNIVESWKLVLTNWGTLNAYLQGRTRLSDINSEFQNILIQIKNAVTQNKPGAAGAAATPGAIRKSGGTIAELQSLKPGGGTDHPERVEFPDVEDATVL